MFTPQGHIALDSLVFPEGTLGSRFDSVARLALWQYGLDYNHGTGHGVGAFLNVHEGPQGIGFRKKENEVVGVLLLLFTLSDCLIFLFFMSFQTVNCLYVAKCLFIAGLPSWYDHIKRARIL